jgi:pimeloyl-ACP methyl ester carboxylesterase
MRFIQEKGPPLEKSPVYVLIPGAWHGAWSWRPVAERLRAAGNRAVTLTLPGLGDGDDPSGHRLRDAVDYVVDQVRQLDLDNVIFVAHSWGGYPATGAAHQLADRVSKVIYYNAFVPVNGQCLLDDSPPEIRHLLITLIDESPSGIVSLPQEYSDRLLPEAAPETQRMVANLLTPQPGRYFLDVPDFDAASPNMAIVYLAGERDGAMPLSPAVFAARLGVEPIAVPGPHSGMLTHPDEVANAILTA